MKLFTEYMVAVIFVLAACTSACSQGNPMTVEKLESAIAQELSKGSSSEAIEQFFNNHGLPYTYDRFTRRYQSIIRDVSASPDIDHAIVIYIYVDETKAFTRAEVLDSFT